MVMANGGMAMLDRIETKLFKKNGQNWVQIGVASRALINGNIWNVTRHSGLAAGEYKVEVKLYFDQYNPAPPNGAAQVTPGADFTHTVN